MAGFEQFATLAAAGQGAAGTAATAAATGAGAAAGGSGGVQFFQVLQALGTGLSVGGTILTGLHGAAMSRAQAQEFDRAAAESRVLASQRAAERRRRAQLLISRSQAVAADSGAGPTDPTVLTNEGKIFQEGEYQAAMEKYAGESRANILGARGDAYAARSPIFLADSALGAGGTILSGVSSYYDKYGRRSTGRYRYDDFG